MSTTRNEAGRWHMSLTTAQRNVLHYLFLCNPNLSVEGRRLAAARISASVTSVDRWFLYQREKYPQYTQPNHARIRAYIAYYSAHRH
jgi:succinylglutamate desuccinylase